MSGFKSSQPKDKFYGSESATLNGGKAVRRKESSGVTSGLSERTDFDAQAENGPIDYKVDSLTGNSTERLEPRTGKSVSGKNGSFDLIG